MFALSPDLIANYLNRRVENYKVLKEALAAGAIEPFHTISHQLAGNASSYGFPELQTIAKEMEKLSREDLSGKGEILLRQFYFWLRSHGKFC